MHVNELLKEKEMFHELQKKQEEELYKDRGEPYFNDRKSGESNNFINPS